MKAGFIGLGHIGLDMARELVLAGHDTAVYDLMPAGPAELCALGAARAASPAETAAHAEMMAVCVRSDQDVLDVFTGENGLLEGARPGLLVILHSTVRPSTVHKVAALAQAKGVRVVDGPVSRASLERRGKVIVYMLGGEERDVEDARLFVAPSARSIVAAGPLGAAMALKISNNLANYLQLLAGFEAFNLAKSTGLDPALLLEVMKSNNNITPTMLGMAQSWIKPGELTDDELAHWRQFTAIGEKDLDCAIEAAREAGLDLPAGTLAREKIGSVMKWKANAA